MKAERVDRAEDRVTDRGRGHARGGMLVLSRGEGQALSITTSGGEVIRLKVCKIERGKVRLGIDAPLSVRILREELIGRDSAA